MTTNPTSPEAHETAWNDGLTALHEVRSLAPEERARWCRIGAGLLAGRFLCPADLDFGDWVDGTGYRELERDARQNAMWLSLNQDLVLPLFEGSMSSNPDWIRKTVRRHHPQVFAKCYDIRDEVKRTQKVVEASSQNGSVTEASVTAAPSRSNQRVVQAPTTRAGRRQASSRNAAAFEERKARVCQLLCEGRTYAEIQSLVRTSWSTVKQEKNRLERQGKLPSGSKPQFSEKARRASRGHIAWPAALPKLTREQIDPEFDQGLREKLGREPTKEERDWAWVDKHGHVAIRTWEQREAQERAQVASDCLGQLQAVAKECRALCALTANPRLEEVLQGLSSSEGGQHRLRRAAAAYETLLTAVESLRPFFPGKSAPLARLPASAVRLIVSNET